MPAVRFLLGDGLEVEDRQRLRRRHDQLARRAALAGLARGRVWGRSAGRFGSAKSLSSRDQAVTVSCRRAASYRQASMRGERSSVAIRLVGSPTIPKQICHVRVASGEPLRDEATHRVRATNAWEALDHAGIDGVRFAALAFIPDLAEGQTPRRSRRLVAALEIRGELVEGRSTWDHYRQDTTHLASRNENPKPYQWKADGAKTLAKIQRAREPLMAASPVT